jgi:hypothetical protein
MKLTALQDTMKVTGYLALLVSAGYVLAAPAPEPITEPETAEVKARDLTRAQCRLACETGPDAMERVCRLIPHPVGRSICWGLAAGLETSAGEAACMAFCGALDEWL